MNYEVIEPGVIAVDVPEIQTEGLKQLRSCLDINKPVGIGGTQGTASNEAAFSSSPENNTEGTQGTAIEFYDATDLPHSTVDNGLEKIDIDSLDTPCYLVRDDWFEMGGKRKSGVWFCNWSEGTERKPSVFTAVRICSPFTSRD